MASEYLSTSLLQKRKAVRKGAASISRTSDRHRQAWLAVCRLGEAPRVSVSRKKPNPSAILLSFLQNQLMHAGPQGTQAARKLEERLDTVAFKIRLPLPSDRSCNK